MHAIIRFINRRVILFFFFICSSILGDNKKNRTILCYHGISNVGNTYTVSPEQFERQMQKLSAYADFVSLDTLLSSSVGKQQRPMVSITFDDGYTDVITVLPILKKYNIPATVFALAHPEKANRRELEHTGKLLSYAQLRELKSIGLTIGCHSATHADFHAMHDAERKAEIVTAKQYMEKKLGFPVTYFAYPKGRINAKNASVVKKAGYKAAFTTEHSVVRLDEKLFNVPRTVVDGTYTEKDFPAVISPSTFFIQNVQRTLFYNRIVYGVRSVMQSSRKMKMNIKEVTTHKKKLYVSVGISVYNEERNIKNLVTHILKQKGSNIVLKELLIVSDGSTDKTESIIRQVRDKRVKVVEFKNRQGKSERLNYLFKVFTGDVLVVMDGDGYLSSEDTISLLVQPFFDNVRVGLVAGRMVPVSPRTLLERAVVNYYNGHYAATKHFGHETSAYGCHGLLAYKRDFAKSITIPQNCIVDDAYSYFSCLAEGFEYAFQREAIVHYRCPQKVSDYLSQSLRYYAGGEQLNNYFEKQDVMSGYTLPRNILLMTLLYQLKNGFFEYLYLKVLHAYVLYKTRVMNLQVASQWAVIHSSKML